MAARFVKIKTWNEMKKEYGISTGATSIKVPYGFTQEMEQFMPEDRIIELDKNTWKIANYSFMISDPMIEEDYGETDPRLDASNIINDKEVIISDPEFNAYETTNKWYIPAAKLPEHKEGYLHSDLIVRKSCYPFSTGYYLTKNSAMFAKLRYERLQKKGSK